MKTRSQTNRNKLTVYVMCLLVVLRAGNRKLLQPRQPLMFVCRGLDALVDDAFEGVDHHWADLMGTSCVEIGHAAGLVTAPAVVAFGVIGDNVERGDAKTGPSPERPYVIRRPFACSRRRVARVTQPRHSTSQLGLRGGQGIVQPPSACCSASVASRWA